MASGGLDTVSGGVPERSGPPLVRVFGASAEAEKDLSAAWPEAQLVTGPADGPFEAALVWDCAPEELADFVDAQPGLRWLHTIAAGTAPEVLARLTGRAGLVLTNGSGTHGRAVAEHVLALALAHCKRLPQLLDAQCARRWQPPRVRELGSMRAGIVGLGDLGRSTARLLTAFGTEVVGLRRDARPVAEVSATYGPDRLDVFCADLDLLVVAAPLTPETRALIGRRQLAQLRPGALLVNVGRGPVVDEQALLAALRTGRLSGAALDVFATEPLPADSPLWSEPGVVITPHCADTSPETDRRCLDLLLDNIERHRSGRPLRNVVQPGRGY